MYLKLTQDEMMNIPRDYSVYLWFWIKRTNDGNQIIWVDDATYDNGLEAIEPTFIDDDGITQKCTFDKELSESRKIVASVEIENLVKEYPQFERDTFWIQELEARNYLADNTANTPFIDKLCNARNIDKASMVFKIITNADNLKLATAEIIGKYQASL